MKVSDIRKLRDRTPFRAFRIHLTNGETLPVPHPEYLAAPPEADADLFVLWVGTEWNLIDATQVARMSPIETRKPRRPSR